jgi:AAA ATPase-like protein
MGDIAAVTGQRTAVRDLVAWAASARVHVEPVAVLSGPSGCGKTWVAHQVAEMLPDDVTCAFASGDRSNANRDYLPFASATMSVVRQSFVASAIPEVGRSIPHFGGIVGFLLQYIVNRRETEQSRRSFTLDQSDREILLRLDRIAARGRLLLVLDDLQWWDERSIGLAQLMISGRVNDMFPFLNNTAYLALTTTGQAATSTSYDELRKTFTGPEIQLGYCDESDFGAVLQGLGLRMALRHDTTRELYRITRGHLAIARQLVDYLNRSQSADDLLLLKTFEQFCHQILDARVSSVGPEASILREILSCAATIGMAFSRRELECIANDYRPQVLKCIRAAKALNLFEEYDSNLRFLHELYPRVLKTQDLDESRDLHSRFAKCLQRIRPGDYRSRARHHLEAEESIHAHVCEIHALLADLREGRAIHAIQQYPDQPRHDSLRAFYSLMQQVYAAFGNGEYERAIALGRTVDETLPLALRAECDWVIASSQTRLLSSAERENAAKLLERWAGLAREEPELWSRLALARVVALGQMNADSATKAATEHLLQHLSAREDYDVGAERMMNRIKLRADLLYETDVAHYRLREARSYFGPPTAAAPSRDPLCYYLALLNLSGNEIMLGRYSDACETAAACKLYIESVQGTIDDIRFPRPDVLANNTVLSAYRAGRMPAHEAAAYMESILATSPMSNDSPLMQSNRVALSVAAGELADPSLLEIWFERLSSKDYEPYFVYFVGNNLAATWLALGDVQAARKYWQRIAPLVGALEFQLMPHMSIRHARLTQMLLSDDSTLEICERTLRASTADAVGPTWDHHAHVFLLSELQLWSEG